MVGLQIGLDFGVSILPMIIYHVGQLMLDTLIVQHWAKRYPPGPVAGDRNPGDRQPAEPAESTPTLPPNR